MRLSTIVFFLFAITCIACKKDWLEARPDNKLIVPSTVADYQALLDQSTTLFNRNQPSLIEISSGDFFIDLAAFNNQSAPSATSYIWDADIYQGGVTTDWNAPYQRVLNANIVLEGIEKVIPATSEQADWNNVKGSALFYRSFDFYHLAQQFCKTYDSASASQDMGIPLRVTSDINQAYGRGTVQQTYDQIIADLTQAVPLLPATALYKTRPSKVTAYALLGRAYLVMGNYVKAFAYTDSALAIYSKLMDYNNLTLTANNPFPPLNDETIFEARLYNLGIFGTSILRVEKSLLRMYHKDDLRLRGFFRPNGVDSSFKGSYTQSLILFGGIATDELYLMRAECSARKGDTAAALKDLNDLMRNRWNKAVPYPRITATSADDALVKILQERRKELCFRGIRWTDLRRLNKDPRFAVTLTRTLGSNTYTLPPNSIRYVFPIPDAEIRLSGIEQNPR